MTATRPLAPALDQYASELLDAGFTVYLPTDTRRDGSLTWFHYSREVEGQTCYGTVSLGEFPLLGEPAYHTMPITPSRLNGSGAYVGAQWGDPDTLGLNDTEPLSVKYARAVARPTNWCPYNTDPSVPPSRSATGATMRNTKPWGIGTHYLPCLPTAEAKAASDQGATQ